MNMFIIVLAVHIAVALSLTVCMAATIVSALKQRETKLYGSMLLSFGSVLGSGVLLLFASPGGFGRFCVMMSAFTALTFAIRYFYLKQTTQISSV